MKRILTIAGIGIAGIILTGQAFAGASEPVRLIDPANPSDSTVSVELADTVLAQVLPYYRQPAPEWCAEDMACWIGSDADGRSDAEILANLPNDITESSRAYAG